MRCKAMRKRVETFDKSSFARQDTHFHKKALPSTESGVGLFNF